MKRIILSTAVFTFVLGLVLTWGGKQYPSTVVANQGYDAPNKRANLSGEPELKFIRFISNQYHTYAQFNVTNGGSETMRFPGYAKNSNCVIFIRRDGVVRSAPDTQSGKGFGTQLLLTGETITFDVQLPDDKGAFEVGFAYEVGAEHLWKILWSEKVEPRLNAAGSTNG